MVSVLLTAIPPIYGAKPSLLTQEELNFAEKVGTGEYAYEVDEKLSYGFGCYSDELGRKLWRPAGSDAEYETALWIKGEMENIGLQNVAMEPFPVHGFTPKAESYVQVISPEPSGRMLGGVCGGLPGTVQSPNHDADGGITREVVYVGLGRRQDYEALSARGISVEGKIVLVDVYSEEMYWLNMPHMQAELEGAVGLIVHWLEYQQVENSVCVHDSESRPTLPAITVSHNNFAILKELSLAGPTMVKMWADCELTIPDKAYNVVGYIPGTTHPDELIIMGAIFDQWWYGSYQHESDVSAMMQCAKALVDSGYKPDRTLVFVAISAEEYGWTDTLNAWAIGSHFTAHYNHTDWAGRSRAFIEFSGSLKGDYTVSLSGDPGTYMYRRSVISEINEFFTTHAPWSAYYVPASVGLGGLPGPWTDRFNYGTSGMETMSCSSRGSTLYNGMYHTQNDTMEIVSAEALAMNAIANGINTISLDRAPLAPYNFAKLAALIGGTINDDAMRAAGISTAPIYAELNKLQTLGDKVWGLIQSGKASKNIDAANALLMQATKELYSTLLIVGGWGDEQMLRHEHYQVDTTQLRATIEGLEAGKIDALWNLLDVYCGYYAYNVDYAVYYHFIIECTSPDYPGLMWGDQGREAHYTDIYPELYSLMDKRMTGNTDYSAEIASLQAKYETAVANLEVSVDTLITTLSTMNTMLTTVQVLLK